MIEPELERGVHLDGCSSSRNLFDSNEDFVGEIVSERYFVLMYKFCKGDYGEEKQVVAKLSEEGGQIYFFRNSGQGGDLLGFICPIFLTINRFYF